MSHHVVLPPSTEPLPDGSRPGGWWHVDPQADQLVCDLCPRQCSVKEGRRGFCFVRENRDGQMVLTTYGRSTGFCIDPIEKKPLNQFFPGTAVLSFGTAGCNLGCKFCQNWESSKSRAVDRAAETAAPETIAEAARQLDCKSVAFTYNDPIIWAEYAIDTARACRAAGVKTVAVTSGYISEAARGPFYELIDAANVDLKSFSETFYRDLTASHLQPVLDTLVWLRRETDVWLEITNLIIPRENDSPDEIRRMCNWILEHLGNDVPIHFSAFHPDFRMLDHPPTPIETLLMAHDLAQTAGLKYVYTGNVHDARRQSTYCPACEGLLIQRDWYQLGAYHMDGDRCAHCGAAVAGHFDARPGTWGQRRMPVQISQYARPAAPPAQAAPPSPPEPDKGTAMNAEEPTAPQLTPEQQHAVLHAACEQVAAAVVGRAAQLPDPSLAGADQQNVLGAFVTLKRGDKLRACCGFFGRKAPLRDAILHAAVQTATNDTRLPPISPEELPHQHVDVWLLHEPQPVRQTGRARIDAVVVGRHGLQIERGAARGLLLPGVATDNHLDAEQFLQAVCRKAGLPPTAWQQEDVRLLTFEGVAVEGPFATDVLDDSDRQRPPLVDASQARTLAQVCRNNLVALVQGGTPSYYLPGCPDGTVEGVSLTVGHAGGSLPALGKLSLRPGLPLQATLFELTQSAAQLLRARGVYLTSPDEVQLDLSVLTDPAMHGSVAQPSLEGCDAQRRALLVSEGEKFAWVLDPDKTAEQLLDAATSQFRVQRPEAAGVFSLLATSTQQPMTLCSVPRPRSGPSVRPPAVAGTFYPADAAEIDRTLDGFMLSDVPPPERWPAAMVPHAGWIYSGQIALDVLRQVEIPPTVVILCPKHTRGGVDWAVAPQQTWGLPGRNVESDVELAAELADRVDGLQLDAAAHAREHAIEVQLPLLARLAPQSRVVGITIGGGDLDRCKRFGGELAEVVRSLKQPPLLLVSTDMNHYAGDAENRRLDALALASLERLDPNDLYRTISEHKISMCGMLPAVIVLETLRQLGVLSRCKQIAYDTSATASGDTTRVVGYAGMLFG